MADKKEYTNISDDKFEFLKKQIEGIQYGTVTVTIHEGRITQIDSSTKTRFNS